MSFSDGNRAETVNSYLSTHSNITIQDLMQLQQHNYTDFAARSSVPKVVSLLQTPQTARLSVPLAFSADGITR